MIARRPLEVGRPPRRRPLAERIRVGVDHRPSRWLVQREAPAWVGVGRRCAR
ncbi:MAG TPA: hypothetical protein VGJ34_03830 [Gaiellaceae bacterium]